MAVRKDRLSVVPPARAWFGPLLGLTAVLLLLWLASGVLLPRSLAQPAARIQGLVTVFLGIFIEALPFLLAGVLASSVIHLFVTAEQVQRLSPRNPVLAALAGTLLGLAFPVCECGSVPTARRLMAKGAPVPLGIAFVLAAPVVNPIVIVSTWVAFSSRPSIVLWRVGLTILFAAITGLAVGLHPRAQELLAALPVIPDHDHDHAANDPLNPHHIHSHSGSNLRQVLEHASGEFFEMGRYLVIGGLIAAALQSFVPRQALAALGQDPLLGVLVLMGLAVALSICSTVDAFVALAFVNSFLPGSVLAFLVFGPMIDIKSVLMFGTTFRRRTVALMTLLPAQLALLAGVVINLYL